MSKEKKGNFWVDTELEALRREKSLCYHCARYISYNKVENLAGSHPNREERLEVLKSLYNCAINEALRDLRESALVEVAVSSCPFFTERVNGTD